MKLRDLSTNLTRRLPRIGSAPADPEAELGAAEDRHLRLLNDKRLRLRAYVAGELARAEAGEAAPSTPATGGRVRRGK